MCTLASIRRTPQWCTPAPFNARNSRLRHKLVTDSSSHVTTPVPKCGSPLRYASDAPCPVEESWQSFFFFLSDEVLPRFHLHPYYLLSQMAKRYISGMFDRSLARIRWTGRATVSKLYTYRGQEGNWVAIQWLDSCTLGGKIEGNAFRQMHKLYFIVCGFSSLRSQSLN